MLFSIWSTLTVKGHCYSVPELAFAMGSPDNGPEYQSCPTLAASPGDKPDKTPKTLCSADPTSSVIQDTNHSSQSAPRHSLRHTKTRSRAMQISPSPSNKRGRVGLPAGSTHEDEIGEPSTGTKFSSLSRQGSRMQISTQRRHLAVIRHARRKGVGLCRPLHHRQPSEGEWCYRLVQPRRTRLASHPLAQRRSSLLSPGGKSTR
jgi:hypothetical protein